MIYVDPESNLTFQVVETNRGKMLLVEPGVPGEAIRDVEHAESFDIPNFAAYPWTAGPRPTVVAIMVSDRDIDYLHSAMQAETALGSLCFVSSSNSSSDGYAFNQAKIRAADKVVFVNPRGKMSKDVGTLLAYAVSLHKDVTFTHSTLLNMLG